MIARLAMALMWLLATTAHADPRPYRGPHPLDLEGHWHDEDAVHVHDDLPIGLGPFGEFDGVMVFLGDPLAYGYSGATWTYRGAHPVPGVQGYCAIAAEHSHPFAPEGTYRRDEDGAYAYIGALRGGLPMILPRQTAAPVPVPAIVARPLVAGMPNGGPYYYGGCLHQPVMGPRGPTAVPVGGCVPTITRAPPSPASVPAAPAPFAGRPPTFPSHHSARGNPIPPSSRGQR